MSTLILEFWTEDNDFHLYAELGDYEKELTLAGQADEILSQFKLIYNILENLKEHKEEDLQETIESLSTLLIAPFAKQLQKCNLVRFVVYEDLIRCTFDLLLYEGTPLFLQRAVCYQIAEGYGVDNPKIKLGNALLIADLTADPEKACQEVAKLIPEAEYIEVEDANLSTIRKAADQVDALIVSAHGDLDKNNDGGISINDETIGAKLIGKLEAWIVYFDSCQQGVNITFLQAFQENSDVQFYLAPIISNDAGDSSTKTMTWFFTKMLEHGNPLIALFETRKRLFEFYTNKKKLSFITCLNKSFPFRIYEFVAQDDD
jgi:hypothetical protein